MTSQTQAFPGPGAASDTIVARAELFRVCPCSGEDVLLAADDIGCTFLERVCAEALAEDTMIAASLEEVFPHDAVTEVQVLTNLEFIVSDDEDPFLRVLFVRAILDHISRGFEVLFVEDDPEQFPVWQKTIGVRRCGRVPPPGSRCAPGHVDASLSEGCWPPDPGPRPGFWAMARMSISCPTSTGPGICGRR